MGGTQADFFFLLSFFISGAFLLGYLLRPLSDRLTISGVPLLWPIRRREYGLLPAPLRIRLGGRVEYAVALGLVAADKQRINGYTASYPFIRCQYVAGTGCLTSGGKWA